MLVSIFWGASGLNLTGSKQKPSSAQTNKNQTSDDEVIDQILELPFYSDKLLTVFLPALTFFTIGFKLVQGRRRGRRRWY